MINEFNKFATSAEKGFNIAGSIPAVGFFPAALRVACGKVQFISGIVFAGIGTLGMMVKPNDPKWDRMARAGIENIIHGALNVIRGLGEAIASLSIIGSVVPLTVNLLHKPKFAPFCEYGFMQEPHFTYKFVPQN